MSSSERQRRFLNKLRGTGTAASHQKTQGQLKVRPRQEFGEVAKLQAEIRKLQSDLRKLKAMLEEQPDLTKLRQKIVDQQVEMVAMRRAMKEIAKERDKYQRIP